MKKEEVNFIEKIKNENIKTVVDVGANIGKYTSYINSKIPNIKLHVIEPIESCFYHLNEQYSNNKNVFLYNELLSDKKETVIFHEAIGKESHSSIVNREWLYEKKDYNIKKKEIETTTLDNLISDNIDILKIDTEGYELNVLKGAKKLLSENKIKYIQFEYGGCFKDNNIKLNDVISFLNIYGYKVYRLENNNFIEINDYKDDYEWINFFAKK